MRLEYISVDLENHSRAGNTVQWLRAYVVCIKHWVQSNWEKRKNKRNKGEGGRQVSTNEPHSQPCESMRI